MAEEEFSTIYEARDEKMISPTDGKSLTRIARFLKPIAQTANRDAGIPQIRQISQTSHSHQHYPSDAHSHQQFASNLFKAWVTPQRKWKQWVERLAEKYSLVWNKTGILDAIISSTYEIRCSRNLILGLLEFWCEGTNTFVFPWGEATITLEDVMILGGFPVLGELVTIPLTKELSKIEEELHQQMKEISRNNCGHARHCHWIKHFMEKEMEIEHVAFLSLWLSRYVFPSSTISKHVFRIAIHLSKGTPIALAPSVLASLYQNLRLMGEKLRHCSLESTISLGGFQLLQLWAWERVHILGPNSPNKLRPGEPRVARWHKLNFQTNVQLVQLALRLQENFRFRPYGENLKNWRHLSYYREREQMVFHCANSDEELNSYLKCLVSSKLVGLDCREKYQPHRVAMQFGMDQDIPGEFACLDQLISGNVKFFVSARSFQPAVSERYFKWWKELHLACHGNSVKKILNQAIPMKICQLVSPRNSEIDDTENLNSNSNHSEKEESHASVTPKSERNFLIKEDPSATMLQMRRILETSAANETLRSTALSSDNHKSSSMRRPEMSQLKVKDEDEDDDDIPFSIRLRRYSSIVDGTTRARNSSALTTAIDVSIKGKSSVFRRLKRKPGDYSASDCSHPGFFITHRRVEREERSRSGKPIMKTLVVNKKTLNSEALPTVSHKSLSLINRAITQDSIDSDEDDHVPFSARLRRSSSNTKRTTSPPISATSCTTTNLSNEKNPRFWKLTRKA